MNVFEIFAKLGLDTKEYESGLNDAKTKGQKWASGIAKGAKIGATAVATVGTAVIGVSTAFTKQAGQVAEYGDHIDKMSQKIGISAEAYQEWDAVMQHTGASIDSLRPAMKTLATQAQKGNDAFKKLGISEKEVANLSNEDLFSKVVSGLQGMEEGTERTYLASQLLGRGATELGALLNTSAKETQAMKDRVHELGGVMSDEAVKASARFQDSLQDMQTSMQGLKRNFMADFLPSFADVMDGLADIFSGGTDKGLETISKGIDQMVAKFSEKLPKLLEVVGGIVDAILMAIIENLPNIFEAGADFVMKFVEGVVDHLPQIIDAGMKAVIALIEGIAKNIDKIIPAVVQGILLAVDAIIDNLPLLLDAVLKIIKGVARGIVKAIPVIIKELPKIIKGIVEFIVGSIDKITESAIELFMGIIDALPDIIDAIVEALPQIIDAIVNTLLSPDTLAKMIQAGIELFVAIVSNIPKIIAGIIEKIPEIITGIVNGFLGFTDDFEQVGVGMIEGIKNGILKILPSLLDLLGGTGRLSAQVLRNALDEHSPSGVTEKIGAFAMEGMEIGVDKKSKDVINRVSKVGDDFIDAIDRDYDVSAKMNFASLTSASVSAQNGYLGGSDSEYEEIIIPRDSSDSGRDLTVILELDKMQLGRAVYRLNNEETQRVGVQLAGV